MTEEHPKGLDTEKLLDLGPKATAKAYQDILKKIQGGEILTPGEIRSFELLEKKLKGEPEEKPKAASDSIVDSLEKVAAHFRKSVRQIRNWRREGMPCLSGDRFDLMQIEAWRAAKKGGRGPAAPDGRQLGLVAEGDKDYQDMRAKRAMADLRELEYRKRLGELVERSQVEALFAARAMAFKVSMLGFARVLPPLLIYCTNEREIEAIISRVAREHLENICRRLPEKFGAQEIAKDSEMEEPQ